MKCQMDNACVQCGGKGWILVRYKINSCCICKGTKKYYHSDKPCAHCSEKGYFSEPIYRLCPWCKGRGERHWIDDILRPLKDIKCSEDQKNMCV